MTDDIVIEDPIGESVTNPDGTGVRGKEAVRRFCDANIGPTPADGHLRGDVPVELARRDRPHPGAAYHVRERRSAATVRGVFTYKVNDDGLITNLRGYWNMDVMEFVRGGQGD